MNGADFDSFRDYLKYLSLQADYNKLCFEYDELLKKYTLLLGEKNV